MSAFPQEENPDHSAEAAPKITQEAIDLYDEYTAAASSTI